MKTVGIICEYNPFHLGHLKQLRRIREHYGQDTAVVCLMSGNFVQRGHPALLDKSCRAQAALACGADLVLELPVTAALSSAEGFAAGGVAIASRLCDALCFGSETGDAQALGRTARLLLSPAFPPALRQQLDRGLSFPAARQAALAAMGADGALLTRPNDILGVEYCKAILSQGSELEIWPIARQGGYHDPLPDPENPSATAVRRRMLEGSPWQSLVPPEAAAVFAGKPLHTLQAGENGLLARLRTMTDEEFEALPFGGEGLWRRLMHASRREATLEAVLTATKSKRYTRTRLDRMVMCACLGITGELLARPQPYTRILGFTRRGRQVLRSAREGLQPVNAGQAVPGQHWELEKRCGDLYGLFCCQGPEPPGAEQARRVIVAEPL